jgi:hypothetical protein
MFRPFTKSGSILRKLSMTKTFSYVSFINGIFCSAKKLQIPSFKASVTKKNRFMILTPVPS